MSQRKAKEYRRAMEQYTGVAEDVDDLKRRVGALEAGTTGRTATRPWT